MNLKIVSTEVVTLIGRNGAGKTTTVNSSMGIIRPCHVRGGRNYERAWRPELKIEANSLARSLTDIPDSDYLMRHENAYEIRPHTAT